MSGEESSKISMNHSDNRKELFVRWYGWSLKYKDVDPAVWLTNYLNKRYEHNEEQRYWFAWLYGNTYYLPTSWVLMNEFPDFELATYDRIKDWNTRNYQKLRYQTDTKWSKGHLPEMFKSYKDLIGNKTQKEFFDTFDGFDDLFKHIKEKQFKFGRYSSWFYIQHLESTCGMHHINPKTLLLDDHSGSRSHRNGLCMALGKDDWYDKKLDKKQIYTLEGNGSDILIEMKERFPEYQSEINPFTMETVLCSFKKIFRKHHGRYLGYYLDRQAEEITRVSKDGWDGIEWNVLWQARAETLDRRLTSKGGIVKEKYDTFVDTGHLDRMEWMFTDIQKTPSPLENFMI